MKYVPATPMASFLPSLLLTLKTPCSSVSIVKFEKINGGWELYFSLGLIRYNEKET